MYVIVDKMEKVAHFLIRRRLGCRRSATQLIIQTCKLFTVAAIGLVAGDQRMGQPRRILRNKLQLLQVRLVIVEDRIGQRFGNRR